MLYNELEQEDILAEVRVRLATRAYMDILLRSIGPVHKIRQTPVNTLGAGCGRDTRRHSSVPARDL